MSFLTVPKLLPIIGHSCVFDIGTFLYTLVLGDLLSLAPRRLVSRN